MEPERAEEKEEQEKDSRQSQNSMGRNVSGKDNLFELWKAARRNPDMIQRRKAMLFLQIKMTIFISIATMVFFSMIIQGKADDTSSKSTSTTAAVYTNSTSKSAEMYNNTGSLVIATEEEVKQAADAFLAEIENTDEGYHEALNTKYSGKESNTVVSKVSHITSNFESNTTEKVDIITDTPISVEGAASPKEEKTIYEHILNAEKYNFNNIIWRTYNKSTGTLSSANMSFRVDPESRLKYPIGDPNASNRSDLTLDFFLTKVRPYLQTKYIPFDIIVGTQDAQSGKSLNTDLAYEIITSAYHQIVLDRYKIEKLARKTNYLVYDKTTTTTTTTRSCADYDVEETIKLTKGEACTADFFNTEICQDYVTEVRLSEDELILCDDKWLDGCTYGVVKANTTVTVNVEKTYCIDTENISTSEEKDIRESKVNGNTDSLTYSWNYVITLAKMFDRTISNKYSFEPYYHYSLDSYNNFIAKNGSYSNMTVEQYREYEKNNSKADDITVEELEYNHSEEKIISDTKWNQANVVASIPANAEMVSGKTVQEVKKVEQIKKIGKEYIDKYNWADNLKFEESKSGIYNLDSVKDVTGDDLTADDIKYYNDLYSSKDINIIDLMNSNDEIYKRYVLEEDRNTSTSNIGIRKSKLDISYNTLERDLRELAENYPLSGLMYGNSMGILEGLNLATVAASGGINDAMVLVAESYLGYDLDQMLALKHKGTFFRNHWCAMFVSYCMRTVEEKTGINIPIPNYTGCTTGFWDPYNSKPGFFDVQEWASANPSGRCVQTDPTHIAPLSSIQPGDIIFYCWTSQGDRDHTAIVKSVERDASGNVTKLVSIDGNWGGAGVGEPSYNYSKVKYAEHVAGSSNPYTSLSSIASFVSISTVMAEAEKGNIW